VTSCCGRSDSSPCPSGEPIMNFPAGTTTISDQRHLGRRSALCRTALQNGRQDSSAPLRGGMGICSARGNADGVFLGQRDRQGQRQLYWLRQPVGQTADGSGWLVRRQCLRACTICTAMFGSGSRIASTSITSGHPRMARRGRQVVTVIAASFAVIPDSTFQTTSARPTATGLARLC
jgi:hypothetical protein